MTRSGSERQHLVRLTDVPYLSWLPRRRGGRKLDVSSLVRWARLGVRGHRLAVVRVGGALCTTENELRLFFTQLVDATTRQSCPKPVELPRSTPESAIKKVEQALDRARI